MKSAMCAALLVAALAAPTRADLPKPSVRTVPADFALQDDSGRTIRLSTLKGKVVLLDFWATWCTGCKVEIPWFMEFQKTYAAKGFAAVGVAMDDEGWGKVRPYLAQHPFNYPIVVGTADLAKHYGVVALPVTVLIDRKGKVAATHVGVVEKGAFERELQTLLQERP